MTTLKNNKNSKSNKSVTPAATEPTPPAMTGVANGNNTGTKVDLQAAYLALIAGLLAVFQPDDEFDLPSGVITRDLLIAAFQKFVGVAEATKASNQAWRADVQAERVAAKAVASLRSDLKANLQAKYGKTSAQLLKFGITPAKVPVKTTTVKAAAVAKSKATRKVRGTMGKVQRLEVTGNVTGVMITPVTAVETAASSSTGSGASAGSTPAASASPTTGATPAHS